MQTPRNPYLTVDIIIGFKSEMGYAGIVMMERKILLIAGRCRADSSITEKHSKQPQFEKQRREPRST